MNQHAYCRRRELQLGMARNKTLVILDLIWNLTVPNMYFLALLTKRCLK